MSCPWWDDDDDWPDDDDDESPLKDAFVDYDPIYAEIVTDRETGRSRGFGFVAFEDSESKNDAIKGMDGQELGGRTITVSEANQRSRRRRRG